MSLTAPQKDILRAGMISGWSTQSFCPKESIENQVMDTTITVLDKTIRELMNFDPPLVERGSNGLNYRFSKLGAIIAKEIIKNVTPFPTPLKKPLKWVGTYTGRGENNQLMIDYAEEIGGAFVKKDPVRCSKCNHKNTIFIEKGKTILCQVCFKRGERF